MGTRERGVVEPERAQVRRAPRPRRGRRRARPSGASSRSWWASARVIASRSRGERRVGEAALGRVQLGLELGQLRARGAHRGERRRARRPATICGRKACTSPRRRVTVAGVGRARGRRGSRSSVDLPPPLGPSTPIRAPSASSRSRPVEDAAAAEGLGEAAGGEQRDRSLRARLRERRAASVDRRLGASRSRQPWTATSWPPAARTSSRSARSRCAAGSRARRRRSSTSRRGSSWRHADQLVAAALLVAMRSTPTARTLDQAAGERRALDAHERVERLARSPSVSVTKP